MFLTLGFQMVPTFAIALTLLGCATYPKVANLTAPIRFAEDGRVVEATSVELIDKDSAVSYPSATFLLDSGGDTTTRPSVREHLRDPGFRRRVFDQAPTYRQVEILIGAGEGWNKQLGLTRVTYVVGTRPFALAFGDAQDFSEDMIYQQLAGHPPSPGGETRHPRLVDAAAGGARVHHLLVFRGEVEAALGRYQLGPIQGVVMHQHEFAKPITVSEAIDLVAAGSDAIESRATTSTTRPAYYVVPE